MDSLLAYYAQPGAMTDAGPYATHLSELPGDIDALCHAVQGLMLHIFWAERMGVVLPDERKQEVQLRSARRMLGRLLELDDRPLTEARPPERKLVGNCRDFSVMLTTILRHQGVPARARCGFGRYFLPDHYEDHWVAEYWDAQDARWRLVDAQLDAFQCAELKIAFDPLDVPRDQFIVGGQAWKLCRSGQADPDQFGIFDMHGLWFVRGDFLRDVAALNKTELLPWDGWGLADAPDEALTAEDYALLDQIAELTYGDVPDFDVLRALYAADDRLRVPDTIRSYSDVGAVAVQLSA
ncbi:MAG: transglutaminase-like domain-containing protein [Chloroflexota bacterium]|nr:transglutaminase-like domain-containing protein [Chloroflexota bacterium]